MKRLSRKGRTLMVLAFIHLSILASGMTGLRRHSSTPVKKSIFIYERLTGAGGGFGFFSPNVGNQVVARFTVHLPSGEARQIAIEKLSSAEVSLRYGNMVRFFTESYEKDELRRAIAASLTAHVFGLFPDARSIDFATFGFQFPSLADYRAGARPTTLPIYQISFRRAR